MDIVPYAAEHAADVAAMYNRAVAGVPHCRTVSPDEAAAAMAPALGEPGWPDELRDDAAWLALDGGRAVGFVHAAVEDPPHDARPADADPRGMIRFLWHDRGRRGAGQKLLGAAEARLRDAGLRTARAGWSRRVYDWYHVGPAHLSQRLEHVHALLAVNGYQPADGEVFLDWRDVDLPDPPACELARDVSVDWRPGREDLCELAIRAHRDGRRIGVCEIGTSEEPGWAFVYHLDIEEPFQGRGLGRALLHRGLAEARRRGCRHAAISTGWDNYRAQVFYSNYGFHAVDWTFGRQRDLAD